ncbi:MAG: porin, partial [Negativicutes bacterium]|nr:porin [Negativicutes bacterium]
MKKTIAAALTAMMLMTGSAFAAEFPNFDFNGDVKFHYRWETKDAAADTEGGKVWFRLNAKTALTDNIDAYARLSSQSLTGDHIGADFDKSYAKYSVDGLTVIDRYGIVVKGKGWNYNIGRQGATVGGTALLYSTEGYTGINMGAVDGLTVTGKSGVTSIQFVAGEEWKAGSSDNKLYAVRGSYSPAKDWTVGATYGKYNYAGATKDTNHYAVDFAYNVGKAGFFGEYTKSSADAQDTAYDLGVTYAFDAKNSAYVIAHKTEANGDMGGWTDFDNNEKGFYYGFDHKVDKNKTL